MFLFSSWLFFYLAGGLRNVLFRVLSGVIFLWFVLYMKTPLSSKVNIPCLKIQDSPNRKKLRALGQLMGNKEVYPNLSRSLEKVTLLHSFLNVKNNSVEDHFACGDDFEQRLYLFFLILQLAQVALRLCLLNSAVRSLHLWEDYHSYHPTGGLSDSVWMHFLRVFVVVVVS